MNPQLMVEQPTDILTANLKALASRDLALAHRFGILAQEPSLLGFTYTLEATRADCPTLVAERGEHRHYLHSKYDPLREATELVEAAEVARRGNAVCFGLGLGYVLEAILANLPERGEVLVIEPDPEVVRIALDTRDLSGVLGDPRVHLMVRPTREEAFSHWATHFSMLSANGIAFVTSPNIEKRLPGTFAAELADQIRGYLHTVAGNMQTLMVMAHLYQANTLRAVPYLVRNPAVKNLFGQFQDVPVVCVAAGPSLEKQLPLLAQVQDRCLIIACDTATRPLLNAGITPHIICAGDPQEANHRHIAGLAGSIPSYLCAEPMTYPHSLAEFQDRLFVASFRDRLMAWFEEQLGEIGRVLCWGSVATMVFDLARLVGGNPVIFLGQDLSFPGGRTYVPGTYFETELGHEMTATAQAQRLNDPHLMEAIDIEGQPVQTNRQMFAYHRWFVREIAATPDHVRVINATEGGILKEGVEIRTFAETVDLHFGDPIDAWGRLAGCYHAPTDRDVPRLAGALREFNAELLSMDVESRTAFKEIGQWYKSIHALGKLPENLAAEHLAKAENYRKLIFRHGFATTLVEMANQTGIKSFLNAHQALNGKTASLMVYQDALDAYLKLYASVYQVVQRLRAPAADALAAAEAVLAESPALREGK